MGDGVQRKYAIIINGDKEPHHLKNVDRAIKSLRAEDSAYQFSVVSPKQPSEHISDYKDATEQGLKNALSGIQPDDDDLLVVYFTGHGSQKKNLEECAALKDSCLSLKDASDALSRLHYGRRIVVMDMCDAGGRLDLFANQKSDVISLGAKDQHVFCQEFAPYFWSEHVKDRDGDGIITIEERYDYAIEQGKVTTFSQFYSQQRGISFSGELAKSPAFKPTVIEVSNEEELAAQLKKLHSDQKALVSFSMPKDECVACKAYAPKFDQLAREYDGQFLMIRAVPKKGSEERWSKYGVGSYPTVQFIDSRGKRTEVANRDDPMSSLLLASFYDIKEQNEFILKKLKDADPKEREKYVSAIPSFGERAYEFMPVLMNMLIDPDVGVREEINITLYRIASSNEQFLKKLLSIYTRIASKSSADKKHIIAKSLGNVLARSCGDCRPSGTSDEEMFSNYFKLFLSSNSETKQFAQESFVGFLDQLFAGVTYEENRVGMYFQRSGRTPKLMSKLIPELAKMAKKDSAGAQGTAADILAKFIMHAGTKKGFTIAREQIESQYMDLLSDQDPIANQLATDAFNRMSSDRPAAKSFFHNILRSASKSQVEKLMDKLCAPQLYSDNTAERIEMIALLRTAALKKKRLKKAVIARLKPLLTDPVFAVQEEALKSFYELKEPVDMLHIQTPRTSTPWHIGASAAFMGDTDKGAGLGTSLDFGYRFKGHWSLDGHLGAFQLPQSNRMRISLQPDLRYHFLKQPGILTRLEADSDKWDIERYEDRIDPYVSLPAIGVSYDFFNEDGESDSVPLISVMAGGLGFRWHLTDNFSAELAVRGGLEIAPTLEESNVSGRFDVPLNLNADF